MICCDLRKHKNTLQIGDQKKDYGAGFTITRTKPEHEKKNQHKTIEDIARSSQGV